MPYKQIFTNGRWLARFRRRGQDTARTFKSYEVAYTYLLSIELGG